MAYTAVKSYKATNSDEISVNMGSVVEVLQKSENGWWLIRWATPPNYDRNADEHRCQRRACRVQLARE